MQRNRSFSVKPAGLLFSLAISSSLLILLFSFWAFSSPSTRDAHLHFSSSFIATRGRSISSSSSSNDVHLPNSFIMGNSSSLHFLSLASYNDSRNDSASCDLSNGAWVLDDSFPLYTNRSCSFIDEGFNCEANGRPDNDYMKWRWRPHGCNIPRFDASKMLSAIRGKRLVFVGDSINRNQWESLLCLLSAGRDPTRIYEAHGRKITKDKGNYSFKFLDYKCSVEYYVTHFLVKEAKAKVGTKRRSTLRLDRIHRSSSRWRGADFLIFNSNHWWTHQKTRAGVNYFQEGERVHHQLDVGVAFRKAMMTWAAWIDKNVDQGKTQVFFRTSSPSHFRSTIDQTQLTIHDCQFWLMDVILRSIIRSTVISRGGEWNSGGHCGELTQPIRGVPPRPGGAATQMNTIVEEVVGNMTTPVTLLDITRSSGLRIDGHPSIYGRRHLGATVQDCSHWCLPGVPDSWNELLFFHVAPRRKPPQYKSNKRI